MWYTEKSRYKNLLHILKQLRSLTPDGLIFDDMNFSHWPPNGCIHLCDMELPRSINVKCTTAKIPAFMPRVFTTNREFNELWSTNSSQEELNAIRRRCHVLRITEKMF